MKSTEQQPAPGDHIVHCEHSFEADSLLPHVFKEGSHWFGLKDVAVTAPDGKRFIAQWFVVCDMCHTKLMGNPKHLFTKIPVGGYVRWEHDIPVIAEASS